MSAVTNKTGTAKANARWASCLLALLAACTAALAQAAALGDARIALVVGNSAYRSAPLANPVNDTLELERRETATPVPSETPPARVEAGR